MNETLPLNPTQTDRVMDNRSGGVDLQAAGDVAISGDVVGRDKIVQNIYERALTAAEEAQQRQAFETQALATGLSTMLQQLRQQLRPAAEVGPYRGLLEYRLADAEVFSGRERAVAELQQRLAQSALTVLHSESGAGKTSLLQAGLASRLIMAGHLPVYLRPYDEDPAAAIKHTLLPNWREVPALAEYSLREFLQKAEGVLGATSLCLMLDQFEEFYTRVSDQATRDAFADQLAECLDDATLQTRWIVSVRAEYFSQLASLQPRVRHPFANEYRLALLTHAEAQTAMTRPLERLEVIFEADLLDRILNDLGQAEIAPPQLQLVCATLYQALPAGEKMITRSSYQSEGGAAGILHGHLNRVLSHDLPAEQRQAARRLLESLITSEQQRIIRTHQELVDELTGRGMTPQTLDVILNQLVENRLVKIGETEKGPAYELAHDYLLEELRLDPEVQARKAAQELFEQEVRAYHRHHTLLSADRLRVIEPYVPEFVLSAEGQELLAASRAQRDQEEAERQGQQQRVLELERRGRRRLQGLVFVLSAVLLVVLGMVAYRELLRWDAGQQGALVVVPGQPVALEQDEVSNDRYRLCVQAGECIAPPPQYSTYYVAESQQAPLTGVDAIQASLFCRWIGRRLPSLAEWQAALRQPAGSWTSPEHLADRTLEWTATLFDKARQVATRQVWNGAIDQLPERIVVVGSNELSVLIDGAQAEPAFRRADIGFRCAVDAPSSAK